MNTTTRTQPIARSVAEWAATCGFDLETMHLLLETMKPNTIVRIGDRVALDPTFVARFATAFGAFDDLELDADRDDDERDPGGRVGIENDKLTLPRPARSRRAGQLFSSAGGVS